VRARLAWGDGYYLQANAEVLPLAMIETKGAVENLDAILAVPGLGGVYIGPADLALSHGFAPGFDREDSEMLALIRTILSRCCAAGVPCCVHCGAPEYAARMAREGMALVTVGSDARFVEAGAKAAIRAFRSAS
jgi:4-hydroxy-2-oxoheptanedioate aldolase